MPFDDRTTLASPTGAALNLYARRAAGPGRAVVQVNHGLAEHAARYAVFADFLAARGIHTYAHDHRGHGRTTAPGAPLGRFAAADGGGKVLADVLAVHDHIAAAHPGLPVVVFGHSMGALIALDFTLAHSDRIGGAALWNADFSAGLPARAALAALAWERFRLGSDMPSRIMPMATFRAWNRQVGEGRTAFDWLSRDHAAVDAYIADPLCGFDASVSLWRDVVGFVFSAADDAGFSAVRRDLPFNLVGGSGDPYTRGGRTITGLAGRLRAMGFSNLVSTIYPGNRHESLNELERDTVMRDFLNWLDGILPR